MTSPVIPLNELPDLVLAELDSRLLAFDRGWSLSRLDSEVAAMPRPLDARSRRLLIELVKIDLERRWRQGEHVSVPWYLSSYPQLAAAGRSSTLPVELLDAESQATLLELLQAEYFVRRQFGEADPLAQLAQQFPQQAPALRAAVEQACALVGPGELGPADQDTNSNAALAQTRTFQPAAGGAVELPPQFGRYRIARRLGKGGMGTVYLAHDTQLDREVALKVPHFAPEDGREVLERFLREARAAATFNHPNLCQVYDVGQIDGIHYLTMPYLQGRPLSDYVQPQKHQPERQVAAVVRKLALAMAEAHERGVIHRDLKPANIMISPKHEPVVTDFGLARRADAHDAQLTQGGSTMGTPAYMPPEQIRGNADEVGPACDIYSLGVILYELLTGRLPFRGNNVGDVLARIITEPPPPPSQWRSDLDPALEAICLKALEKRPADRFASMSAMATALDEYLRGESPLVARLPAAGGDDTLARQLFEQLSQVAPQQSMALQARKAARGDRLTANTRIAAACVAGMAFVVLAGVVYLMTDQGTITLEVKDPEVDVRIDGQDIAIDVRGKPITLRSGEHTLQVTRGKRLLATKRFTVRRGQRETLPVALAAAAQRPAVPTTVTPTPNQTISFPAPRFDVPSKPGEPLTPQPPSTAMPLGAIDLTGAKLLHQDEFDDPNSGFRVLANPEFKSNSFYEKGRFIMRSEQRNAQVRGSPWTVQDFACCILARTVGSPTDHWSMVLSHADPLKDWLLGVHIYGNGEVVLQVPGEAAGTTERLPAVTHSAVKTSPEFNELLIVVRGRQVDVQVNGIVIQSHVPLRREIPPAKLYFVARVTSEGQSEIENIAVWDANTLPRNAATTNAQPLGGGGGGGGVAGGGVAGGGVAGGGVAGGGSGGAVVAGGGAGGAAVGSPAASKKRLNPPLAPPRDAASLWELVWLKNSANLEWVLEANLTPQAFEESHRRHTAAGWNARNVIGHRNAAGEPRLAGLWFKGPPVSVVYANHTLAEIQEIYNQKIAGNVPSFTNVYFDGVQYRRSDVFVSNTHGRGWESRTSDKAASFQANWDRIVVQGGSRPVVIGIDKQPTREQYYGLWRKDDVPFRFDLRLTRTEYEKALETLDEGWRPDSVDAYVEGGTRRYAVVWIFEPSEASWRASTQVPGSQLDTELERNRKAGYYPALMNAE